MEEGGGVRRSAHPELSNERIHTQMPGARMREGKRGRVHERPTTESAGANDAARWTNVAA